MEALILSCGTGGGHNSAGRAILEEMTNRGHHATMINPYTLKSTRIANGIDKSYLLLAKKSPRAFGTVYKLGDMYRKLPFRSPVYFFNKAMYFELENYLANNHFDVVLMPHVFPAEILTGIKKKGIKVPKMIFLATDYVCIPFTEETDCDAYVIPAPDLASDFARRGIDKSKLYPLGIPTAAKFQKKESKKEARASLGLSSDKTYILISGGSMGGGKISKIAEALANGFKEREDVELIVITASNTELFEKLSRRNQKNLTPLSYTEEIDTYMRACDLFVTKPGGLSSTEAAVCGVPLLHTGAIPGCETYNAEYFVSHKMSKFSEITEENVSFLEDIINDRALCHDMVRNQKLYINNKAASDICALAESIV